MVSPTQPTAADYGEASIPHNAVWVRVIPSTFTIGSYDPSTDNPQIDLRELRSVTILMSAREKVQLDGAVDIVRDAAEQFLQLLQDTGATARIIQYATVAQELAPATLVTLESMDRGGVLANALLGYYNPRPPVNPPTAWEYDGSGPVSDANNWNSGGADQFSNWDAAFDLASSDPSELIVVIDDGDPDAFNLDQPGDPVSGVGYNTFRSDAEDVTVNRAIEEANAVKAAGSRVLVAVLVSGRPSVDTMNRLKAISGPQVITDADVGAGYNLNEVDALELRNHNDLIGALPWLLDTVDKASINVHFPVYEAGVAVSNALAGLTITVEPTVPGGTFDWVLPDTTAGTEKTATVNGVGYANVQIAPDPADAEWRARVTLGGKAALEASWGTGWTMEWGRPGDDDVYIEIPNADGSHRTSRLDLDMTDPDAPFFDIPTILDGEVVKVTVYVERVRNQWLYVWDDVTAKFRPAQAAVWDGAAAFDDAEVNVWDGGAWVK